jgi:bacterioferritin
MKGNQQVVKLLSDVLRKELTGINQYFLHAKMCENWGYQVLHERIWKESLEEMKHADKVGRAYHIPGICAQSWRL